MLRMDLNEKELQIQNLAKKLAKELVKPRAAALSESKGFPTETLAEIAKHGFMGIKIPQAYGGLGLGEFCNILFHEEINRACASTGVALSVHNSLVVDPLKRYGNDFQKEKYLPLLANGTYLGAYALSEADHGSDAVAMETRYQETEDGYRINGSKAWITSGDQAGLYIVFATKDPAHRSRGVSAFLVESSFEGFKVGKIEDKLGILGSSTTVLHFDNCHVPRENLLGEEGQGFKIAMDTLDGGRIGIAAQGIGIAQAALDLSMDFVTENKRNGKPLIKSQAIQWKLANMATEIEAGRLLAYRAARLREADLRCSKEASMAKLFCSETANRVTRQTLQILGGEGYLKTQIAERLFRDAKITEIYEGTSEIQRLVLSRAIFNK